MQICHHIIDNVTLTYESMTRSEGVVWPEIARVTARKVKKVPSGHLDKRMLYGCWVYNRLIGEKQVTTVNYCLLTSVTLSKNTYFKMRQVIIFKITGSGILETTSNNDVKNRLRTSWYQYQLPSFTKIKL